MSFHKKYKKNAMFIIHRRVQSKVWGTIFEKCYSKEFSIKHGGFRPETDFSILTQDRNKSTSALDMKRVVGCRTGSLTKTRQMAQGVSFALHQYLIYILNLDLAFPFILRI